MREINIDKWVDGYKVRCINWTDNKIIYLNVQYYRPGQSVEANPAWEKSVYLVDNESTRYMIENFLSSIVNHVSVMNIPEGKKVVLSF